MEAAAASGGLLAAPDSGTSGGATGAEDVDTGAEDVATGAENVGNGGKDGKAPSEDTGVGALAGT